MVVVEVAKPPEAQRSPPLLHRGQETAVPELSPCQQSPKSTSEGNKYIARGSLIINMCFVLFFSTFFFCCLSRSCVFLVCKEAGAGQGSVALGHPS